MNNLPAKYNGAPSRKGLFARALTLFGQNTGASSHPSVPTNTLNGTTTRFEAVGIRLRGASYEYGDGNQNVKIDSQTLSHDHFLSDERYDERNRFARSHAPLFPLNQYAGFAALRNAPWDFRDELLRLASTPEVDVPAPKYPTMSNWHYFAKTGDVNDSGVGNYEVAKFLLQVTPISKSHIIPFARQIIDHSIASKLNSQEKRLLGYIRTEQDPLALPNYAGKLEPLYIFIPPTETIDDLDSFRKGRRNQIFKDRFTNLSDAARFAYENKSQDFSLLEVFTLEASTLTLPAALQGELIAARAIASLSSDEKLFMAEQKAEREARMRNRYTKIAAMQGADEAQDTVKSAYIWLTIDESEELRGSVVAGKYVNRILRDMTGPELFDLYAECRSDPDSKGLCEIYLDYISPRGWKKTARDDFEKAADEITLDQAYAVLGVDDKAEAIEIKKAYRSMVRETHPDRGGDKTQFDRVIQAMNKIRDNRPELHL